MAANGAHGMEVEEPVVVFTARDDGVSLMLDTSSCRVDRIIGHAKAPIRILRESHGTTVKFVHRRKITVFGSMPLKIRVWDMIHLFMALNIESKSIPLPTHPSRCGFLDWDTIDRKDIEKVTDWDAKPAKSVRGGKSWMEIEVVISIKRILESVSLILHIPNRDPIAIFDRLFCIYPELMNDVAHHGFNIYSPVQLKMWPMLLSNYDLNTKAITSEVSNVLLLNAIVHTFLRGDPDRNATKCFLIEVTPRVGIYITRENGEDSIGIYVDPPEFYGEYL